MLYIHVHVPVCVSCALMEVRRQPLLASILPTYYWLGLFGKGDSQLRKCLHKIGLRESLRVFSLLDGQDLATVVVPPLGWWSRVLPESRESKPPGRCSRSRFPYLPWVPALTSLRDGLLISKEKCPLSSPGCSWSWWFITAPEAFLGRLHTPKPFSVKLTFLGRFSSTETASLLWESWLFFNSWINGIWRMIELS